MFLTMPDDQGNYVCPGCGETMPGDARSGQVTWAVVMTCGFSVERVDKNSDQWRILRECSEGSKTSAQHACTCPIGLLMAKGCQCGGI